MGKALYRKYRSKSLSEVVGQEHITSTLENSLKNGTISHAYLFTGPHGVGKTSIARILAHEVNQFPYDESQTHVDIIEIDAASNRRIDEMRDLRDRVNIAPVAGKYKVYIIDEVHMLTREAFNALLKTLEEPPAHVIFILATTEAHKLPQTIISRTQRHSFKPIEQKKVVGHLKKIAKSEKAAVSDEALELIAQHGQGSFRDSISLLDQVTQQSEAVTADDVRSLLGVPPAKVIQELLTATSDSAAKVFEIIKSLQDKGYNAKTIAHQLSAALRNQLLENKSILTPHDTLTTLQSLLEVESAHDPYAKLELVLLDMYFAQSKVDTVPHESTKPQEAAVHNPTIVIPAKRKTVEAVKKQAAVAVTHTEPKPDVTKSASDADFSWEACLEIIKKKYNTLYGILRIAQAETTDNTLTLTFRYGFHQKKISDQKNKTLIHDVISEQCGQQVELITRVDATIDSSSKPTKMPPVIQSAPKKPTNPAVDAISNIFGAAEVLE